MKSLILKCNKLLDSSESWHTSSVKCFSNSSGELAEGPVWNKDRNSLIWVDILSRKICEKRWMADYELNWELPVMPSSVAIDNNDSDIVWVLTESALCKFNLSSNVFIYTSPLNTELGYRTNDGCVGPDGRYWFGTMKCVPEAKKGNIYSIGTKGDIKVEFRDVAIPNTFCWLSEKEVLITDSFERTTFVYNVEKSTTTTFLDYSQHNFTPDGGALDIDGNIWIALWGAGKVGCYSKTGSLLTEISVPVQQPSSCCFGGPDMKTLFITSAREGLQKDTSKSFALSGRVFQVNVPVQGAEVLKFDG